MKNRKDTIKNIAIVFLAILLVLTFFSNTIMNRSLVEVSTQMISGDSITSKVRGSGTATAGDTYAVSINESRKIATINVKTGQEIDQGTVLFTLTETESDELTTAQDTLLSTQRDYELAVLDAGITPDERKAIENGTDVSLTEKQNALLAAKATIDDAQDKVNELTAKKTSLDNATVDTSEETKAYAQAQKDLADAEVDKTNKETAYQNAKDHYDELKAASSGDSSTSGGDMDDSQQDATELEDARNEMQAAYEAFLDATTTYNELNAIATQAQKDLDDAKNSTDNSTASSEVAVKLEAANRALEQATNDYTNLSKKYSSEVSLRTQYESIVKLEDKVAKLKENASGAEITAPISGTIVDIMYTAGQTTAPQETVMTIQPQNKAYTLQFSVTSNQAKRIKVGDNAEIMYNYYGNDVSAKVSGMHRDPNNRDNTIVVCELSGDVNAGDSYTVSIGEQSASYDFVVPTSCIKEDKNGKFILTIEAKSTPLGNRYYARRVDVQVITSDDSRSAVTGTLEGGEYVITTTTKPVEANQMVRLATEE